MQKIYCSLTDRIRNVPVPLLRSYGVSLSEKPEQSLHDVSRKFPPRVLLPFSENQQKLIPMSINYCLTSHSASKIRLECKKKQNEGYAGVLAESTVSIANANSNCMQSSVAESPRNLTEIRHFLFCSFLVHFAALHPQNKHIF